MYYWLCAFFANSTIDSVNLKGGSVMVWTVELSELLRKKLEEEELSMNKLSNQTGLNYRTISKLLNSPGVSLSRRVYQTIIYWMLGIEQAEEVA